MPSKRWFRTTWPAAASVGACALVGLLAAGGSFAAQPHPATPIVAGPRSSESERVRYTFTSHERGVPARAIRFRCALDAKALRYCPASFAVRLPVGVHILRVQAVDPQGRQSAITRVRVEILEPPAPSYQVGVAPLNVIAAEGKLWTVNYGDGTVSVFDPATKRATSIRVGGQPGGIAFGAGAIWVSDLGDGTLTRITPSGTIVTRVSLGGRGAGVVVDRGVVYVADYSGGLIRVDASTNQILGRTRLPGQPEAVAIGFGRAWVTNGDGTLTAVNPESGAVDGAPITIGADADDISVGQDALWVVALNAKTLARVDPSSHRVVWRLRTPGSASGVLAAGETIWVSNYDRGTVSRIDPARRQIVKSYRVGSQPRSLAEAAGAIWVANQGSGSISRIAP